MIRLYYIYIFTFLGQSYYCYKCESLGGYMCFSETRQNCRTNHGGIWLQDRLKFEISYLLYRYYVPSIHFRSFRVQQRTYVRLFRTKTTPVSLHCLYVPESREPSQTLPRPPQDLCGCCSILSTVQKPIY